MPSVDTSKTQDVIEATTDLIETIDEVLDENVVATMEEQAQLFDPAEPKPYSLADAMREGATMGPQVHGGWGTAEEGSPACALTSTLLAVKKRGLA